MSEQVFIPLFLDKSMWDFTKPMLFFSEVYLEQLSDAERNKLNYRILEPYENIRNEHIRNYIAPFVDNVIAVLEVELSKLHKVNYSHDYWHRLLFAWLEKYCLLKYYQVELFENVRNQFPEEDFYTWIYESSDSGVWKEDVEICSIGNDSEYFARFVKIGERFFDLTVIRKQAPCRNEVEEPAPNARAVPKKPLIKRIFQKNIGTKVLHRIFCKRPKKDVKVLYINSYLKGIDLYRMVTLSHGKIRPIRLECKLKAGKLNTVFRQRLQKELEKNVNCESLWQRVCSTFLAEELSAVFIEWYSYMHEISLHYIRQYPNLKVIRGISDFYYSYIVPFCSFLAKEHYGVNLLGLQHGGNYGIVKGVEYIEKCEEDVFYGWGSWADHRSEGYRRGPSGKLYQYLSSDKSKDYILFVGTYIPTKIAEGSHLFNSRDGVRYISWQLNFFKSVNQQIIPRMAVRNYYVDGGWHLNERLEKEVPGICITNKMHKNLEQVNFSARDDDFVVALSRCSMMICDHLSTTWLEALAADKPLLMFYPKDYYIYEESELPYIKMMEEAGILVHSPEEAAETLNQIADNIDEWWAEPARKRVVDIVKERYISLEKDIVKWWVNELLAVAEE